MSVWDAGANMYTIQDVGDGATLAYTVGGCLAGISNYTATKGTITVSGTINSVKVDNRRPERPRQHDGPRRQGVDLHG